MYKEQKIMDAKIMQAEGLRQWEIAQTLGVTERTVRNYLNSPVVKEYRKKRRSKLDLYRQTICAIIKETPHYNIELLFEKLVAAGYQGKISILRDYAAKVRKRVLTEAVIRFETMPGQQAQVDWKEFGTQDVDSKQRKLYAFVMALGYSRLPYVQFTLDMKSDTLYACHIDAFKYFGGVPREILYDNMRTAFVPDGERIFRPARLLVELAAHYGFIPKRCPVRRPQTKGKVERSIGYLSGNFWERVKAETKTIEGLNESVLGWIDIIKSKTIGGMNQTRAERFDEERVHLLPLPETELDVRFSTTCIVNRESMITWETNCYSVSPELISTCVELRVDRRTGQAEIFHAGTSLRRFTLASSGSRKRIFFDEDQKALEKRWCQNRDARQKREFQKFNRTIVPEVIIRNPSEYDHFAGIDGGVQ